MKNTFKQKFAFLLAMTMLLSTLPTTAFATEETQENSVAWTEFEQATPVEQTKDVAEGEESEVEAVPAVELAEADETESENPYTEGAIIQIANADQLAEAIANQKPNQTWKLAAGTYTLKQEHLDKYANWKNPGTSSQGGWYFPIYEDGITIEGEGDVLITSGVETSNGAWATQDFVSVWGQGITIDNVDFQSKSSQNKVIEVMGKDFTLKNAEMKKVDENGSGSIIFNSQTADKSIGTATLENVKLYAWVTASYSESGTLKTENITIDFTDNTYAGYKDDTYGYGWCPVIKAPKNGEVQNENATIIVDNKINLVEQVFNGKIQPNTTVRLTENVAVDKMLDISTDDVTLDLNGHTITASENFTGTFDNDKHLVNVTGDNVTIEDGILKTTNANKNALNVYHANGVVVNNVVLDHTTAFKGGPMVVNASDVTIQGEFTAKTGNTDWYAVNVDQGNASLKFAPNTQVTFDGINGILRPAIKVEGTTNVDFGAGVTIAAPEESTVIWAGNSATVTNPGNAGLMQDENGSYVEATPEAENTITVTDEDGNVNYYKSLPTAIAEAKGGATVELAKGTYTLAEDECLVLDKKLTIKGQGADTVVVGKGVTDYGNGLFTFTAGSEGSVLRDLTVQYTATGAQRSAVYFDYGFAGDSNTSTVIENVAFKGSVDLNNIGREMAIASTYIENLSAIEIRGCTFKNFAYAMYFNNINNLMIDDNVIDGTKYNAINIAGDNESMECENISITDNTLKNISHANYEEEAYSSGIRIGTNTEGVALANNDITMLNSKKPVYIDPADGEEQRYIAIFEDNGNIIDQRIAEDGKVVMPPLSNTNDYEFDGWKKDGKGTTYKAGETVEITADTTFTAQWDKISSGGGASHPEAGSSSSSSDRYEISKPSDVENGSIKVSDSKAEKGDTVTITATPDEGYELDELVVYDEDGDDIDLKDKGDGKFTFEMPKGDVEIEVSFATISDETPKADFVDVPADAWYAEAVQYVYENGMMSGTSETTFSPDLTTTRGMIVTILYRLENEPTVAGTTAFTDVAADQYYANAVAWAAQNGIVSGIDATTFAPNNAITREQMAAILYRYAQFKGYDVSAKADLSVYTDAATVGAYATDAMAWANGAQLITGTSATTLTPAGNATRAQVATILMRFCENIAK
ncbi:MAG: S-layer homology domain-containing protein [Butyricicoccus pullicaecorum]|nr:S-layer homology domain-containing protein [Butyricicoccus pullicaecorum]